jgi:hypothetical protein
MYNCISRDIQDQSLPLRDEDCDHSRVLLCTAALPRKRLQLHCLIEITTVHIGAGAKHGRHYYQNFKATSDMALYDSTRSYRRRKETIWEVR